MSDVVLPQGVSEATFAKALEGFRAAVGAEHVLTEGEHFAEFRDPFQPPQWDTNTPSIVVMPQSTEEVQAVVRVAAEHGVPIWTHSTGKNNGYGGAAPLVQGTVTVSLRRMNKILHIDEELAYAEVEPGVTWRDLYDEITRRGLRLMMSNTDLGWGSVIGNSLENGFTYGVNGNDHSAPCGMEVVTADGDVLRTGMGAMTDNPAWHTYKSSFGPSLDRFFTQSNFGIVTKMGIWLLPAPEVYHPVWVRVWNYEDLIPLVDTLRELRLERTIEAGPVIYNTLMFACVFGRRSQFYDGPGAIPDHLIDGIAKEIGSGRWMLRAALFGRRDIVERQFARIKDAFGAIPGAEVWGEPHSFDEIPSLENPGELVSGGVPNLEMNHMVGWYSENDGGHIGFSPVVPLRGRDLFACHNALRETLESEAGLDYMTGSVSINARTMLHVGLIMFNTADEDASQRAFSTTKRMVSRAAELGYGEFRSHLTHMDEVAAHYDFNDHAYLRFVERIKDAVDPKGILAPGKQGIWPEHLRSGRNGRTS
ncbi:unannotated protein [freshwater metagenome]|uniref:Unannotated protein n=1 Tax=freshwater metagenome TaxID=449393 RepID=A0A6J7ICL3_9ZZZZ|nr:FAD-binding protein [Actinomycetota bacterium]